VLKGVKRFGRRRQTIALKWGRAERSQAPLHPASDLRTVY